MTGQGQGSSQFELDTISDIASVSAARPYLISLGRGLAGRPRITVHAAKAVSGRRERSQLLSDLRGIGLKGSVRLRAHSARKLHGPDSLEQLNGAYGSEAIIYDPTGMFGRSRDLVLFAETIRREGGAAIEGIYWQPRWRTLYVVLDHAEYFSNGTASTVALANAENMARRILRDTCGAAASDYVQALRLSFELPQGEIVPVDKASRKVSAKLVPAMHRKLGGPAIATMLGIAGLTSAQTATAADLVEVETDPPAYSRPAVSGPNAKVSFSGGKFGDEIDDHEDAFSAAASATIPLSDRFGLQVDGVGGKLDDGHYWGGGGHLFWRDPDVALFGLVGGYVDVDRENPLFLDRDAGYVAGEAEVYLGQFTLFAMGGGVFGDNVEHGFIGSVDLGWYATDNLLLTIGAATNPQTSAVGTASIEWQPGIEGASGLAFFAKGAIGENDFASVKAGIRFYFGQGPTLKARHRYDDPIDNAAEELIQNGVVPREPQPTPSSSYGSVT